MHLIASFRCAEIGSLCFVSVFEVKPARTLGNLLPEHWANAPTMTTSYDDADRGRSTVFPRTPEAPNPDLESEALLVEQVLPEASPQ